MCFMCTQLKQKKRIDLPGMIKAYTDKKKQNASEH